MYMFLLSSHAFPLQPSAQVQVKPVSVFVQDPPFRQGADSQAGISVYCFQIKIDFYSV